MIDVSASARRGIIENLLPLGFYYRELYRFTVSCRNLCSAVGDGDLLRKDHSYGRKIGPSSYRKAVANGLVEILSVYRSVVLQLEQRLLADSNPILATVTQGLSKVKFLRDVILIMRYGYERFRSVLTRYLTLNDMVDQGCFSCLGGFVLALFATFVLYQNQMNSFCGERYHNANPCFIII